MNKLQFVALFAGLASTAVAMAQAPVKTDLVIDAVEWVYSGPRADRHNTAIVMKSPRLRVTVRNAGNKRWASSGRVEARVDMGAPGERAGRESNRSARTGVGVVTSTRQTSQSAINAVSSPPFLGNAVIPGSLAPGEKRTVEITLKGKGKGNSHASEHLLMALDKHYTAHVNIQSRGDDQQNNNRADLVFRLNASGSTIDPVLTQTGGSRGTVGVRAPGS